VRLTRRVVDEIADAARRCRPEECCGIVLAASSDPELGVRLLLSGNVDGCDRRHRYKLDHRVQLRAVEAETQSNAVILAYCHSHPAGPARPSRTDAALACPGVAYLIMGLSPRLELRAWRWTGERFDEDLVQVVGEPSQ